MITDAVLTVPDCVRVHQMQSLRRKVIVPTEQIGISHIFVIKPCFMKRIYIILLLAFFSFNCEQNAPDPVPLLPSVNTTTVTSIAANTATTGGSVTTPAGLTVTARGVCWGTSPKPVITGNHTTDGAGTGIFSSTITGLLPNTTYYVRAYATNRIGTSYGTETSFTTTTTTTALPTVTTASITSITAATAAGGGNVVADGNATVTARGVCWSTTANPVATGNHTTDGTGTGIFTSAITGLTAGTTYHVRAYATNSVGTAYGGDSVFSTTAIATPDVYVAGYENNGTKDIAKIWKNGIATSLTDGTNNAAANSVFISGTDVYASGDAESATSTDNAKLWRNGSALTLTNSVDADGNSVFVSGSDVYVGGFTSSPTFATVATIWKNGIPINLTGGTTDAMIYSVFVQGTDVYAVGYEDRSFAGTGDAKIWKNGVGTLITGGGLGDYSQAYSVFVSGTDVYVGGYELSITGKDVAKVWKNGIATVLGNGVDHSHVWSVYVSGTDVYAVGDEFNGTKSVAKLWKNGVATSLTNGTNDAYTYSVFVAGTDVYVAGYESNGTKNVAKIWKNGVATSLTNGSNDAEAYSIFVK